MAFSVGDIVALKSGGPSMTVKVVDSDDITCTWFANRDATQSAPYLAVFPADTLRKDSVQS